MRVALETNALYTTQAGVARYTRGLLHGLEQLAVPDLNLFQCAWPVENFSFRQPQRALKTFYREFIWSKLLAPGVLRKNRTDLFHALVSTLLVAPRPIRTVTTLHDLAAFRYPGRFRRWHLRSTMLCFENTKRSDRVICISRFTAEEAMKLIGLVPSKIEVVYNGCDFHPNEPPPAEQRPSLDVPPEFFLFVGSLEPGKNLGLVKEAYQLAAGAGQSLPPLFIVGARWQGVGTEGRPPPGWRYLGRQPDAVLVYLYRRALALVFPSRYEGFGLPVAEAMALGCPVICSPVASLPEVGGEAALFCELSPAAYLKAMLQVGQEAVLREHLAAAGREQAKQFSWKRCASETFSVYQRAFKL